MKVAIDAPEATYASVSKLFENFGIRTTPIAIARHYARWSMANRSKVDREAGVLGLPEEMRHEVGVLFMPDVIREQIGPAMKSDVLYGEGCVEGPDPVEAKLAVVQAAVEEATAQVAEASGGEANLGYVRLLYDTAIDVGGNSILDSCIGLVAALRKTNDHFVSVVSRRLGRAVAIRGTRALIEAADDDGGAELAFGDFALFVRELLYGCLYVGPITRQRCLRKYKAHALSFIDGNIGLEDMAMAVMEDVSLEIAFFFDRAAHDKRAHLLALDPHRMAYLNSLTGRDVTAKREEIAEAMASI